MHFTLWPSLRATVGTYADVTWDDLRAFVSSPMLEPVREVLPGWSAARFRGDQRGLAHLDEVSAVVLDVDRGGKTLDELRAAFAGVAGLVHSSHSHDPASGVRKWRVVLAVTRPVRGDEYARIWSKVAAGAAERRVELDVATKDGSRFWFQPARRAVDAPYEWAELAGAPIDVDALLAAAPAEYRKVDTDIAPSITAAPEDPAAHALGRAWPASGRHQAQLALAGALRSEGWPAERALDFLCAVCRVAGDEDRPKREATVRHTYSRDPDAAMTGWTRLAQFVPALVVDAVRTKVGRDAGFAGVVAAKLEAARAGTERQHLATSADPNTIQITGGAGLAEPMPELSYIVRELGLVGGGGAPHLVAGYGFSGKTLALQAMLLALAAGVPVWGAFPVARPLRVLHVDLEQGDLTKRRFQRLAIGLGVDLRALGDNISAAIMPRIKLAAGEARWIDLMLGRDLIVVDSLRAACGGSENDSEFRGALDMLGEVSHATSCRALVLHHAKKPGEDDTEARYSIRGSSAIYDAVDSAYVFGAAKGEPVRIEHVKARSHGDLEADRGLVISDAAVGGDPKAGLRVTVVSGEAAAEAKALRERGTRQAVAVADAEIIRRLLTRAPGLGLRALRDAAQAEGIGKDRCSRAISALGDAVERRDEMWNRNWVVRHFLR